MAQARRELLRSTIDLNYELLKEDHELNGVKTCKLRGPLSEGDIENRNRRVYPLHLLKREVDRIMPEIKGRQVIGELDHPDDLKIHLDRVSHVITEAYWDGPKLMGTIEIIPTTDAGKNLLGLVQAGIKLGISSRGMGTVAPTGADGAGVVQEDLRLITWDIVAQPSNYSSWLSLTESYKPIYIDELGYDPHTIEKLLGSGGSVVFRGTSLEDLLSNVFRK
jgi:hypothetical protein